MGKTRPSEVPPEELPSAITLLREMEVQYRGGNAYVSGDKFNQLTSVLLSCSQGEYPHLIKCEVCSYYDECHATQDMLSGKAIKKGRA